VKKKLVSMLLIATFAFLILPAYKLEAEAASLKEQGIIRVKISAGSCGSTTVKSEGTYVLNENTAITLEKDKAYTICTNGENTQLKNAAGTVLYEGATVTLKQYSQTSGDNYIYVLRESGYYMKFQGDFVFKKYGTALGVFNYINMDKYVEGVLAGEVSNSWPIETLKAQAIASRSYAYSYILGVGDYDVVDTTDNQVYYGYHPENTNITAAVQATAKQVVYWNGKLAKTFFYASNGGQTELAGNLWGGGATKDADYGYLQMKTDEYDIRSTVSPAETLYLPKTNDNANTNNKFSVAQKTGYDDSERAADQGKLENYLKTQIATGLAANYSNLTSDITILAATAVSVNTPKYPACTASIYNTKVSITLTVRVKVVEGGTITGATADIPVTLNLDAIGLRNNSFVTSSRCLIPTVETSATGYTVTYRRWGHGIGLSQDGAYQMAVEGKTYMEILNFYFKDITITTLTYPDASIPTYTGTPATTPTPTPPTATTNTGQALPSGTTAKVVNVSSAVNVRSGPGTTYSALGTAKLNSIWVATKQNVPGTDGANWQQITYNGKTGYVRYNYITIIAAPAATTTPTQAPTNGVALASGTTAKIVNVSSAVNVRSGPGTTYSRLGTAAKNSTYAATKQNVKGTDGANWYELTYNGKTGYVRYNYISIIAPTTTTPTTTTPTTPTNGVALASGSVAKIVNVSTAVNVRSGPGTTYSRLGTAAKNSTYTAIKQNVKGTDGANWYELTYNGKTGYVRYNYISIVTAGSTTNTSTASAGEALPSGSVAKVVNVSTAVNVRSGPGTTYSRLGTAKKSSTYTATKKNVKGTDGANWYAITYSGKTGYIRYNYLSLVSTAQTTSGAVAGQSLPSGSIAKVVNVNTAVNVRSGPGTNYPTLGTAKKSTTWTATKKNVPGTYGAAWYEITYSGKTGYIRYNYISQIS